MKGMNKKMKTQTEGLDFLNFGYKKKKDPFSDYHIGGIGDDKYLPTTTTATPKEKDKDLFLEGFLNADGESSEVSSSDKLQSQNSKTPKAEFRAAPSWYNPLGDVSDDSGREAGREHGESIIDDEFNKGWTYAYGKEHVGNYLSPIYNSRYKDVAVGSAKDKAKAEFVAGTGAAGRFALDSFGIYNDVSPQMEAAQKPMQFKSLTYKNPYMKKLLATASKGLPLAAIAYNLVDDGMDAAAETFEKIRPNNAREKQSDRQLEYLNNSELKYLVDNEKARERFVDTLLSEVENIRNTEQFGYLPAETNEKYKEEATNALMRIVHLNRNYDRYRAQRDSELQGLLRDE